MIHTDIVRFWLRQTEIEKGRIKQKERKRMADNEI